jgi:NADH pyrophosphatase NudC (nudix superfamily)
MIQAVELQEQPAKPQQARSITGFVLQGWQKGLLLVLLLAALYLRLWLRKRRSDRICPHCGQRNPPHQTNCLKCSAPLFTLSRQ